MKIFTVSLTEEFYQTVTRDAALRGLLEVASTGEVTPVTALAAAFGAAMYNKGQVTAGDGALSVSLVQDDQG